MYRDIAESSPWPSSDAARGRLEGERGVVEEVGEQPDVVLRLAAHLDRVQHLKQQQSINFVSLTKTKFGKSRTL